MTQCPAADEACVFCEIAAGRMAASVVYRDERTLAFVDLRQFHPGHVLVVPVQHVHDVRDLDFETGATLMAAVGRLARAVSAAFPNQGLSVWHSIGEAAFQEVRHLHFHIHPRLPDDGVLRVYPQPPHTPERATLDDYAQRLRNALEVGA